LVYCSRACDGISLLFAEEIESTLYMLNIISNSLVSIDKESSVKFIFNGTIKDLNGKRTKIDLHLKLLIIIHQFTIKHD
jgi:hypothetical protein